MCEDEAITVDFATLQRLSGEMEDILRELTAQLDAFYQKAEKVVLSWEGEAREACIDALDRWDRSMADLEGAEHWLHEVVENGHINYGAAHRAVMRGWGAE